ncbi:hypothetical protein PR003_g13548 [Phytophthora rubi]|uniref:Uncharacterized protein n=1 Tax=Phytophthora rubi TaxID=129364 RepID=A0A6A3LJK5_9STRA|nr:hypothetical protein PR002_g12767 [Phytophthora rubi]KAE9031887.1 hypothetical protein PR001_g10855 [Phytophthora rubi]KAE9334394.1 hypothetical protein PR003_g13548 [Phytophthora rubi]
MVASTVHLSMLAGATCTSHTTHNLGSVHALLSFLVDRCELSSATKRSLPSLSPRHGSRI